MENKLLCVTSDSEWRSLTLLGACSCLFLQQLHSIQGCCGYVTTGNLHESYWRGEWYCKLLSQALAPAAPQPDPRYDWSKPCPIRARDLLKTDLKLNDDQLNAACSDPSLPKLIIAGRSSRLRASSPLIYLPRPLEVVSSSIIAILVVNEGLVDKFCTLAMRWKPFSPHFLSSIEVSCRMLCCASCKLTLSVSLWAQNILSPWLHSKKLPTHKCLPLQGQEQERRPQWLGALSTSLSER